MILGILINLEIIFIIKIKFKKLKYLINLIWFMPIIFSYFFNLNLIKVFNDYKIYNDIGWIEYYGSKIFINIKNYIINLISIINYFYFINLLIIIIIFFII